MGLFDMPLREQPREVEEKRSLRRSCSGAPGRPLGAYLKEQAQAAAFSSIGSKQRRILPVNVFQMLSCVDGRHVKTETELVRGGAVARVVCLARKSTSPLKKHVQIVYDSGKNEGAKLPGR